MKHLFIFLFGITIFLFVFPQSTAHVPYLEFSDYSQEQPFIVKKSIEQSIACYSWIETDGTHPSTDVDFYQFTIKNKPKKVYIELIVPVVDVYATFVPWFALVRPELPAVNQTLPFPIPDGYGVIIDENVKPGEDRETFHEPFGGKSYYKGPIYEGVIDVSGPYYVYYWDPYNQGGDYVAVLGGREIFGIFDIFRALIFTPLIRKNLELHVPQE